MKTLARGPPIPGLSLLTFYPYILPTAVRAVPGPRALTLQANNAACRNSGPRLPVPRGRVSTTESFGGQKSEVTELRGSVSASQPWYAILHPSSQVEAQLTFLPASHFARVQVMEGQHLSEGGRNGTHSM